MGINHSDFEKNLDLKRPRTRQSQSFFRKKKIILYVLFMKTLIMGLKCSI